MVNLSELPETMTAKEIRELRRCTSTTLLRAFRAGEITGVQINSRRILYNTRSVLKWLGLLEADSTAPRL
jgi:hypothetical protein